MEQRWLLMEVNGWANPVICQKMQWSNCPEWWRRGLEKHQLESLRASYDHCCVSIQVRRNLWRTFCRRVQFSITVWPVIISWKVFLVMSNCTCMLFTIKQRQMSYIRNKLLYSLALYGTGYHFSLSSTDIAQAASFSISPWSAITRRVTSEDRLLATSYNWNACFNHWCLRVI